MYVWTNFGVYNLFKTFSPIVSGRRGDAKVLPRFTGLKALYLHGNCFDGEAMEELADALLACDRDHIDPKRPSAAPETTSREHHVQSQRARRRCSRRPGAPW